MKPPPVATYAPHNSKKRVFPGSSSSDMDPEVIEIMPLGNQKSKSKSKSNSLKQKEVIHHEVIEIDLTGDLPDMMDIDEKVGASRKGKAVLNVSDGSYNDKGKEALVNYASSPAIQSSQSTVPESDSYLDHYITDLTFDDDDDFTNFYADGLMDVDHYAMLQSHFDKMDIPTGVEAPIPWLLGPAQSQKKPSTSNSFSHSSLQVSPSAEDLTPEVDPSYSLPWPPEPVQMHINSASASVSSSKLQMDSLAKASSPWLHPDAGQRKKKAPAFRSSTCATSQTKKDSVNVVPGYKPSKFHWLSEHLGVQKKPDVSAAPFSNNYFYSSGEEFEAMPPFRVEPSQGSLHGRIHRRLTGRRGSSSSIIHTQMDGMNLPTVPPMSVLQTGSKLFGNLPNWSIGDYILPEEDPNLFLAPGSEPISSRGMDLNADEILRKFQIFKKFDTVDDHSDHHYVCSGSLVNQPPKIWAKTIQDEWRILEKNLPDAIFVRVYETRMDLLRAVIVGAEGTPYHDGLFFFDVFFPCGYPKEPPHVYYHSGGLRMNPNLYESGKVCLSLLNTWSGAKNEQWIPGQSTMLQVLVSIQALILNAQPYFNEPGFEGMRGSVNGEKRSEEYSEDTFIKSLKTMIYTMRRPPKYFEDFVMGHFCKHAQDILVACKVYMDGAPVGSLVKGGVQDVERGNKSCSMKFKDNVARFVNTLVREFTQNGAKDVEKFLLPDTEGNNRVGRMPLAGSAQASTMHAVMPQAGTYLTPLS